MRELGDSFALTFNLPCFPSSGGQFIQQLVVVVNDRM